MLNRQASKEVWKHAPSENFEIGPKCNFMPSLGDISKEKINCGKGQNIKNRKGLK